MKNLFYLLSILSLSHFTLPLHAQEVLEEDDTPHTSEVETESIARKEMPITWVRLAVRESISWIAVLVALIIKFGFNNTDLIILIAIYILPDLFIRIIKILPYAYKLPGTQGKRYRYVSDILKIPIASTICCWIMSLSSGTHPGPVIFLVTMFIYVVCTLIPLALVSLIDHFVVSQWIPYAIAEDQEIQESKISTIQ